MAFITANRPAPISSPQVTAEPSRPALQSIFYGIAALDLLSIVLIWTMDTVAAHPQAKAMATAAAIIGALILFGAGQVIGYLGQTAYYAKLTYEHALKSTAHILPTATDYDAK